MAVRIVSFKVSERLLLRIDEYARRLGVARSEVIRYALRRLLEDPPGDPRVLERLSAEALR